MLPLEAAFHDSHKRVQPDLQLVCDDISFLGEDESAEQIVDCRAVRRRVEITPRYWIWQIIAAGVRDRRQARVALDELVDRQTGGPKAIGQEPM